MSVSKEAMKAAKRVKLCSGCDMAGRQCDDCREYDEAHVWIAEALDAFAAKRVAEIKCKWPVGRDESQCANKPTMCSTCAEEMARLDSSSAIQIANENVEQRIAEAVAAEREAIAVQLQNLAAKHDWAPFVVLDLAADDVRARGKDVENA